MNNIVINSFTQFQLTEQQQIAGTLMTAEQKMFAQSQMATIAEQRLALVPDPQDYASFIQQEAYLKGQMDMIKFLLDSSTASEQAIVDAAQQTQ